MKDLIHQVTAKTWRTFLLLLHHGTSFSLQLAPVLGQEIQTGFCPCSPSHSENTDPAFHTNTNGMRLDVFIYEAVEYTECKAVSQQRFLQNRNNFKTFRGLCHWAFL
jgi:hypothetical protein